MKKLFCILISILAGAEIARAGTGLFITAAAGQSQVHTNYISRFVGPFDSVPSSVLDAHNLYWSIGGGYSATNLLRVTAGYEDWGKETAPSMVSRGAIYPLTVGAKGVYASYAPAIKIAPRLSIDPDIGFLLANLHIGTDWARTYGVSDANTKSGYSTRLRLGLGMSMRLPRHFVVGIKYLQTDLPEMSLKPRASFYTDKIRPRAFMLSGQYSFR
jgi:hypothetical protein